MEYGHFYEFNKNVLSNSLSDSFKTQNKMISLGITILHILLSSLQGTIKSLLVKQEYTKYTLLNG